MSEHEHRHERDPRRLVDGVEDVVEGAAKGVAAAVDRVEDAVERAITGHGEHNRDDDGRHHHRSHHHAREDVHMTVNVNLACCPPGKPGGGRGKAPGQPGHVTGTSDGSIGTPITDPGGIIDVITRPPTVWPGSRTELHLPYLFIRAFAGDTAIRPVNGVFWESPDILVMPGVDPAYAPAVPPDLGGVAQAQADNTLYAHAWNLGQAPATDVLVEFYWFNPSLGFSSDQAHLIGVTWTDLAARGSAGSHRLLKCPVSWPAMYVNGGHECLVVRLSQPVTDPLSGPEWDAPKNRHIGQRNIHVMSAAEAAAKPTIGLDVGPLFGGTAQLAVARADNTTMPGCTWSPTAGPPSPAPPPPPATSASPHPSLPGPVSSTLARYRTPAPPG